MDTRGLHDHEKPAFIEMGEAMLIGVRSILLLMLCSSAVVFAQSNFRKDIELLSGKYSVQQINPADPYADTTLNNKKSIEYKNHKAAKHNPIAVILSGTMLFYQHVVSPQLSANCIYTRSCSNFAKQAIKELGLIEGILACTDRLLRCNLGGLRESPNIYVDEGGKVTDEPHHHFHY